MKKLWKMYRKQFIERFSIISFVFFFVLNTKNAKEKSNFRYWLSKVKIPTFKCLALKNEADCLPVALYPFTFPKFS